MLVFITGTVKIIVSPLDLPAIDEMGIVKSRDIRKEGTLINNFIFVA